MASGDGRYQMYRELTRRLFETILSHEEPTP